MTKVLRPNLDRVLIRREEVAKGASLIVIPDDIAKAMRPAQGLVEAVGPTACYMDDDTGIS